MISITLPSNRPDALERTLDNIEQTTKGEVEVIVCSPFEFGMRSLKNGCVVHVFDEDESGCNSAHMRAASYATGDFITPWVDDHLYVEGWDEVVVIDFHIQESLQN